MQINKGSIYHINKIRLIASPVQQLVLCLILAAILIMGPLAQAANAAGYTTAPAILGDSLTVQAKSAIQARYASWDPSHPEINVDGNNGRAIGGTAYPANNRAVPGYGALYSNSPYYNSKAVIVALGTNDSLFLDSPTEMFNDVLQMSQEVESADCIVWVTPTLKYGSGVTQAMIDKANLLDAIVRYILPGSGHGCQAVVRWSPSNADIQSDGIHLTAQGITTYSVLLADLANYLRNITGSNN